MPKVKLTAAAIERIPPPAVGRVEYFDAKLPGFALRVAKDRKSWVLFTRLREGPDAGRQIRFSLGTFPAFGLAEARDRARNILRQVERGEDPRQARGDAIEVVVAEFIERYAKPNNRSWRETKRVLDTEVVSRCGKRGIATITKRDVIDLLDGIMDRGAPYMANRTLAAVRKLFAWAIERDDVKTSPVTGIAAPGKEVERERVLSDDELKAIWGACNRAGYPFGHLVQMLLLTAQRRDEVGKMRWQDLDLSKALWILPREATKGDREHEIPLSSMAVEVLSGLPHFVGSYVFSTTSGSKPVSGYSRAKRRLDELSAVEGWRLHDLRRSAGTGMARLGIATSTISRVLNHKEGGVTKIYNRYGYLDEKRHALEAWANRLANILSENVLSNVVELHHA